MNYYISLLRGVNVGGHKIKMTQLKELYESLQLKEVKTYIQSGNVIFTTEDDNIFHLKNELERELERVFNFHIPLIIITRNELKMVIENNPFSNEDPSKLYVTFLLDPSFDISEIEMEKIEDNAEKYFPGKKEIYLFLPNGYGRARLTNNFFEKELKVPATTRNWKTINKLYELISTK
ncbi:MAG: DUF1697 domain-containing protein [Methanobacterium sp.]|nr:DUF1697 domain-containing protein [Methanobacterium sp.]